MVYTHTHTHTHTQQVVVVGSIASGLALQSSDCDMSVIALGRASDDVLRQVHEEMDRRYRSCITQLSILILILLNVVY